MDARSMRIHLYPVLLYKPSVLSNVTASGFLLPWIFTLSIIQVTHAQVPSPPITSSGLNTQVNLSSNPPTGKVQYDITGGTRPGNGPNLFHSFGLFNVPTSNVANFLNDSGLATS